MLLRRYIGRRLSDYYNQPSHRVVGSTTSSTSLDDDGGIINFRSLWGGEYHWKRLFQRLYQEQHGQWLTPVELFRPHYSHVVTNWIVQQQQQQQQIMTTKVDKTEIEIVEIGGGRGTNAKYILSKLQKEYPQLYERISSYKIFDSSETLHELQHKVLKEDNGGGDFGDKVELILEDMLHVAEGSKQLLPPSQNKQTFVIACELLDNLPHDKIYRDPKTRLLQQAEIIKNKDKHHHDKTKGDFDKYEHSSSSLKETFQPLNDKLLSSILKDVPSYIRSDFQPTWIPSVACGLIRNLYQDRPLAHLLLADFDYLPPPDLPPPTQSGDDDGDDDDEDEDNNRRLRRRRTTIEAENEPLITDMNDLDYECYINSPKYCDILYPTNFYKLALFVQKQNQKVAKQHQSKSHFDLDVNVMKQAEFLATYGPEEVKRTKSWITGYSPLVHDFSNCSVMLVHPRYR